jgi:mitochondrial import inner membrane translocase subunit TIM16
MASRILANLLVMGSGAVFRAMSQAWQKALENARKSGVTAETAKEAVNKSKSSLSAMMPIEEARKVLDITEHATKDEMLKKFQTMFLKNEGVSFYVQSKLVRAKEQLGKTQFGMEEEEWSRDPREEETKENKEEKEKKLDEGNGGGHATETETKEKESS